jgi:hypothetical protein
MQFKASHISGIKNTRCFTQVFWVLLLAILPPRLLGLGRVSKTGQQAAVKNTKTGKRVNLGGESVEKLAVLYESALINDAK